jgi:hypothetical protein
MSAWNHQHKVNHERTVNESRRVHRPGAGSCTANWGSQGERSHRPARSGTVDPEQSLWPAASPSPTPLALDWPPRRGPGARRNHATARKQSPAEVARTPSQRLTGTIRPRGSRPDPTGVSIPLRRRLLKTVTPRGDRSRRFDETAYGTERFLGRDLRQDRRPPVRKGLAGRTPYSCLAPPGLWADGPKDASGDDRKPNHPGANRSKLRLSAFAGYSVKTWKNRPIGRNVNQPLKVI